MNRMLRVSEVSEVSGLSERFVRRLIAQGRLSAVRPHGVRVVLVPESSLGALLNSAVRASRAVEPDEPGADMGGGGRD